LKALINENKDRKGIKMTETTREETNRWIEKAKKYIKSLPIKVDRAILFGSTARGDRLKDSDIDLIVISQDFEHMSLPQRFLILQKNWKYQMDLEAFGFTQEEFDRLKNKSVILQEATEYGINIKA
jgi:predicted nucleotidyltransferase